MRVWPPVGFYPLGVWGWFAELGLGRAGVRILSSFQIARQGVRQKGELAPFGKNVSQHWKSYVEGGKLKRWFQYLAVFWHPAGSFGRGQHIFNPFLHLGMQSILPFVVGQGVKLVDGDHGYHPSLKAFF